MSRFWAIFARKLVFCQFSPPLKINHKHFIETNRVFLVYAWRYMLPIALYFFISSEIHKILNETTCKMQPLKYSRELQREREKNAPTNTSHAFFPVLILIFIRSVYFIRGNFICYSIYSMRIYALCYTRIISRHPLPLKAPVYYNFTHALQHTAHFSSFFVLWMHFHFGGRWSRIGILPEPDYIYKIIWI